ncbi:MAG: cupin domain-containing protein [Candidatus Limnocylindrales bacterium]
MAGVEKASLDSPGETRTFDRGKVALVTVAGTTVGRFTFEPGWRWSTSVKPIVGTETCQNHHVGYAQSGRMGVHGADGAESEIGPGDAYDIAPGHDAWIIGDDTFVGLEFKSAADYAKPK